MDADAYRELIRPAERDALRAAHDATTARGCSPRWASTRSSPSSTTSRPRCAPTASTCPAPEPELAAGRAPASAWPPATGSTWRASWAPASIATTCPPAVDPILSRGEFYTAYTPYQPEISQGTLQTIYEYQSLHRRADRPRVVSASHYDGAAATAEAALMTIRATGRERVLVSRAIHRHYLDDDAHLLRPRPASTSRSCPRSTDGTTDLAALERRWRRGAAGRRRAAWASPTPSASWSRWPTRRGWPTPPARCSWPSSSRSRWPSWRRPASTAPTSRPARASRWASRRSTAGPTWASWPRREALVRQIPGRLVGRTTDLDGRRAFVMTLRAREQDIRRDKAASNICTNQALCALAATVYLATLGPARAARRGGRWRRARPRAGARPGRRPARRASTAAPTSTSSRSACPTRRAVHAALLERGRPGRPAAGALVSRTTRTLRDALLVCATEVTTDDEIERFADALAPRDRRRRGDGRGRPMSAPRIEMQTGPDLGPRTAVGPMLQPTLAELSRARPRQRQGAAPAGRRARRHPGRAAPGHAGRACPSSTSRRSSATSSTSRTSTTRSTAASTRSARAP